MRKNTPGESKRYNLYLKVENHTKAKTAASSRQMTVSDLVDELIERYLKNIKL